MIRGPPPAASPSPPQPPSVVPAAAALEPPGDDDAAMPSSASADADDQLLLAGIPPLAVQRGVRVYSCSQCPGLSFGALDGPDSILQHVKNAHSNHRHI